jgi:hypothetical protein
MSLHVPHPSSGPVEVDYHAVIGMKLLKAKHELQLELGRLLQLELFAVAIVIETLQTFQQMHGWGRNKLNGGTR